MVDRQKTLIDFVTAWAEYEMRLNNVGSEAKRLADQSPAIQQMIARITDEVKSSPDAQRQLAMQLAVAEFSRAA